jgi:16S rRNA (uracil1498-N3)-methyltransferase
VKKCVFNKVLEIFRDLLNNLLKESVFVQRYFVSDQQLNKRTCIISGEDVHHITRVMRYTPGDRIVCCNGKGRCVQARIAEITASNVICDVIEGAVPDTELPVNVTIAQGLPKGDKMEWVLQKGTELGAGCFLPFQAGRSVVRYDEQKLRKKMERWQKVIKEAAEQSHRVVIPELVDVCTLEGISRYAAQTKVHSKLIAYEGVTDGFSQGEGSGLNGAFRSEPRFVQALRQTPPGSKLLVVIGPEGGLEREEVRKLEQDGFQSVSLGPRILRTETASAYILSAISFYVEQMGGRQVWQP